MFFDDLNAVCAATFGEPVTIRRPGRADAVVTGIFNSRHYEADAGPGGTVSTLETSVTVVDADSGPVPRESTVEARGIAYRVSDLRPDGQGMTVLVLKARS